MNTKGDRLMSELYKRAVTAFGARSQILKAVEELTELSLVLQHYLDNKAGDSEVLLEMTDVTIMLNQLTIIFGKDDNIEKQQLQKLQQKLIDRLT